MIEQFGMTANFVFFQNSMILQSIKINKYTPSKYKKKGRDKVKNKTTKLVGSKTYRDRNLIYLPYNINTYSNGLFYIIFTRKFSTFHLLKFRL